MRTANKDEEGGKSADIKAKTSEESKLLVQSVLVQLIDTGWSLQILESLLELHMQASH